MSKITVDAALATQLDRVEGAVDICDPSGKVLGRFVPVFDLNEVEFLTPPVSEEELDRREKSNEKRYTTQEVLDYLRKL